MSVCGKYLLKLISSITPTNWRTVIYSLSVLLLQFLQNLYFSVKGMVRHCWWRRRKKYWLLVFCKKKLSVQNPANHCNNTVGRLVIINGLSSCLRVGFQFSDMIICLWVAWKRACRWYVEFLNWLSLPLLNGPIAVRQFSLWWDRTSHGYGAHVKSSSEGDLL